MNVKLLLHWIFDFLTGIEHLEQCPLEQMIPIFLIGQGAASLLLGFLIISTLLGCNDENRVTVCFTVTMITIAALTVSIIAWQFVGAAWVFSVYTEFTHNVSCDYNAYMCAFTLLVAMMFLYGLTFLTSLCILKKHSSCSSSWRYHCFWPICCQQTENLGNMRLSFQWL